MKAARNWISPMLHPEEKGTVMRTIVDRSVALRSALLITILLSLASVGHAANPESKRTRAGEIFSFGMSAAVRAVDRDLRFLPGFENEQAAAAAPSSRERTETVRERWQTDTARPQDPLLEDQQRAAAKAAGAVTIDLDFDGISFTGATPADASGEAGGGFFVQMVNAPGGSVFAIYNASNGDLVAGPSRLAGLWPGTGACAEGWGHPGVVHDALADRWVLTELGAGNHLCVYVSQTADPVAGGWFAYDFALPKFPDLATLGVWNNGYYVATNEDLPAIYAFQRTAMLAGAAAAWQRFTVPALDGFGRQMLTPVDLDGVEPPPAGTGGLFIRHADGEAHGGIDRLEVWELDVDWGSQTGSSLAGPAALATSAFDSSLCGPAVRGCVPQPGTEVTLDPMREMVMWAPRYRRFDSHESIVGNFTVDTGGASPAAIRWFELRRTDGSWFLFQEGTYGTDDRHRWIGSVAMDRDGNLALAFNLSDGSSTYPSIGVAGREAAAPIGVMTTAEVELRSGSSAQTAGHSPEQWGRSSSVSLDPVDDCTFWATSAFSKDGAWSTAIASFRFPSCSAGDPDLIFACGLETGGFEHWDSVVQ